MYNRAMSKPSRTRKYTKAHPGRKHGAVRVSRPRPQCNPEQLEAHYLRNRNRALWGIFAVIALVIVLVCLVAVDVSDCAQIEDSEARARCRPYSLLEYWANPEVENEQLPLDSELEY